MENDKDVALLGSAVPGDSGVARHADQFAQIADALCDRIELDAMSHSGDIEDEGRQLVEDALRAAATRSTVEVEAIAKRIIRRIDHEAMDYRGRVQFHGAWAERIVREELERWLTTR